MALRLEAMALEKELFANVAILLLFLHRVLRFIALTVEQSLKIDTIFFDMALRTNNTHFC